MMESLQFLEQELIRRVKLTEHFLSAYYFSFFSFTVHIVFLFISTVIINLGHCGATLLKSADTDLFKVKNMLGITKTGKTLAK